MYDKHLKAIKIIRLAKPKICRNVFVHPYTFIVKKWGIPVFLRYFDKRSCNTQMSMFVGLNIVTLVNIN